MKRKQTIDDKYQYQTKRVWKRELKIKLIDIINTHYKLSWKKPMNTWGVDKLQTHLYKQCKSDKSRIN